MMTKNVRLFDVCWVFITTSNHLKKQLTLIIYYYTYKLMLKGIVTFKFCLNLKHHCACSAQLGFYCHQILASDGICAAPEALLPEPQFIRIMRFGLAVAALRCCFLFRRALLIQEKILYALRTRKQCDRDRRVALGTSDGRGAECFCFRFGFNGKVLNKLL